MPIYEYVCKDCAHRFELMRPMKDADNPAACKSCKTENTHRVLSVFYASSQGKSITTSNHSCGGCSGGGSCGSCGH